jgi:hypothetical protein
MVGVQAGRQRGPPRCRDDREIAACQSTASGLSPVAATARRVFGAPRASVRPGVGRGLAAERCREVVEGRQIELSRLLHGGFLVFVLGDDKWRKADK